MKNLYKSLLLISIIIFPHISTADSSATIETHLTINTNYVSYLPVMIYYVSIKNLNWREYYKIHNFRNNEHIQIPPKEGYFVQIGDIEGPGIGQKFSMYGCNNLAQIMTNEQKIGIVIGYWKIKDWHAQCDALNKP